MSSAQATASRSTGSDTSLPAPTRCWYAVHAKTGQEDFAQANLRRQGYVTFLPKSYRTIRHARSIKTTTAAFFPGYLFIALNLAADRWRSVDGTFGVLRIVKAHDRPLPAPQGLVNGLIAATGPDGLLDRACALTPGAAVKFISGPFADQLAVVSGMAGSDRVRVLLSIMNQTVPVYAHRSALAAL